MTTLTTTVRQPIGLLREPGTTGRPAMAAGGITPADIFRVIKQRILLILLIWIFGSAITVGVTMATMRYFPLWTATAHILVEAMTPSDPFNPWGDRSDRDTIERNLANQAQMIRDPDLLREVLVSPEVRLETDWFKQFADNVDNALEDLDENLVSSPVRGSSLLAVSMPTRNPKDSPKIVNKITQLYLKKVHSLSGRAFSNDMQTFENEIRLKDNELNAVNSDIRELEGEGSIPAMLRGAPTVTARLQELQGELVRKESEMELLRARWRAYQEVSPESLQTSPELLARVESNQKVVRAVQYLRDLEEMRKASLLKFGPQHQEIRQLDTRLSVAQEELMRDRQQILNEERGALLESYRVAYYSALQAVAELREAVAESTNAQLDLDKKLRRYDELLRRRDKLEKERERLAEMHQNLLMIVRTQEPARISIWRAATTPLEPSRPRPKLWIPVGVGLSLFVAVGLAMALSLLDTTIRTPSDIIRHASLPLLGTVPILDDEEAAVDEVETASRVAPHSMVAESFRQIRANLLFSAPMEQQRSLLITSASASEGKTCVAINLAVTLAQGGRRILLIDANFRRPHLHKAFGLANGSGLSNLLVGQGKLDGYVFHTDLPNLDVLAAGPCPPNPAELLASSYLRNVLTEAVEKYDQVLVDGPPVLLASDTLVLAALLDGVLLVCRARTGRGLVQRAKAQLGMVNSHVVGAVLNAVESTRGGYFRKYYREFYDYQERQPEEAPAGEAVPLDALPPIRSPEDLQSSRDIRDEFKPPEISEHGTASSVLSADHDEDKRVSEDRPQDDDFKWPGT